MIVCTFIHPKFTSTKKGMTSLPTGKVTEFYNMAFSEFSEEDFLLFRDRMDIHAIHYYMKAVTI